MGGISILAILAMALAIGVVFLIAVVTLFLVVVHTGVPLVVIGVFRLRGHRSRTTKILTIVLGILCAVSALLLTALILWAVWIFSPAPTALG